MLEWRKSQFIEEMEMAGISKQSAENEVLASIDRLVYYAGWADKYQQIFSSVNPVASSHFNFSMLEPTGVVAVVAPEEPGLLGFISSTIPAIAGGNTVVALASEKFPASAITFSEVLNSSDVPSGVVNILTGFKSELLSHFSTHKDVNAMIYCGNEEASIKQIQTDAADNMKRAVIWRNEEWYSGDSQSPYLILNTQETKTTWHPIGV
jgi:acyl-CoA reductase-like NAD-dependent aldehyde dehydrogenase